MSSFRKALLRCISTVLRVTKRDWAISRFERPSAAKPARTGSGGNQLFVCLLGEQVGAEALRQLERLAQVLAGFGSLIPTPERATEVCERVCMFEASG
jgi:hypothetical protein